MSTTSELLATIETGLETGQYASDIWQESADKLTSAQAALAELRQRIADLEAFYDYEENTGRVLKQVNEFWMLAKNHDSWEEHAEWFEALVKRCHRD